MPHLTQYMDSAATEAAAARVAEFLATQDDFIAVRVLAPGCKSDAWRVQALFTDCGHDLPPAGRVPPCAGTKRLPAPV